MFRGKQRSVCLNLEGSVNKQFSVCALAAIAHRKYVYFLMQRQLRKNGRFIGCCLNVCQTLGGAVQQ